MLHLNNCLVYGHMMRIMSQNTNIKRVYNKLHPKVDRNNLPLYHILSYNDMVFHLNIEHKKGTNKESLIELYNDYINYCLSSPSFRNSLFGCSFVISILCFLCIPF